MIELEPMEHRERLLLKRRLQIERDERTPTSSTMQLVDDEELLPWDPTNPNQFFLAIVLVTGARQRIGSFWGTIHPDNGIARLYDFYLLQNDDASRYGMDALGVLEQWLTTRGAGELRLNIVRHSPLTLALLERVGYVPRSIAVSKKFARPIDRRLGQATAS